MLSIFPDIHIRSLILNMRGVRNERYNFRTIANAKPVVVGAAVVTIIHIFLLECIYHRGHIYSRESSYVSSALN